MTLGAILLVGLAFRLVNIGFGLPAMYDPDEPLFVLKAFKLLNEHTLNPGWFGHPGTTTIYLLSMVDVAVAGTLIGSGRFAGLKDFAAGVYAHPGLIFVPSRLAMVAIATGSIWLSFLVARRLSDARVGLLAAALLALNSLHIAWSQVIRTDIHCSFFMLAALLFAIRAAQDGRTRDFAIAGLCAGFATATKWPGASILVAAAGATLLRLCEDGAGAAVRRGLIVPVAALGGLFLASPFIFLDWRTVIANVGGEVASGHLGHSGGGFLFNLGWYLRQQVAGSMGWPALAFAGAGTVLMARARTARATILPAMLVFLVLISAQQQIWSRWLTPIVPMLSIAAAWAILAAARRLATLLPTAARRAALPVLIALALVPLLLGAIAGARERANDTRDEASAWAQAHIPAGSTVVVEHLALDLRPQPWRILFPVGAAGCIDGRNALKGGVRFEDVQKARQGSPIVDLGNVPAARLDSCHADFAILTYYDLYVAEQKTYPDQLATYRKLIGGGRTLALFRPRPGVAGGPVTRIVAIGAGDARHGI